MRKQYVGLVRDHSGSMDIHKRKAIKDYNSTIESIRTNSNAHNIDTIVSVVECGGEYNSWNSRMKVVVQNSSINALLPLNDYKCYGGTPLFESVGALIDIFKKVPDYNSPDVAFLIMAVTDGEDNQSPNWERKIAGEIRTLQASDKWTFVFRVPTGHYAKTLTRSKGIYEGNVAEWELTEAGFAAAQVQTDVAFKGYYEARSRGFTSNSTFFTNIDTARMKQDVTKLDNVSSAVQLHTVSHQAKIKEFVQNELRACYIPGTIYYELRKKEKVQPQKQLMIVDKTTGAIYAGYQARDLLSLPRDVNIKVSPGYHGNYDIFIQSTSVNRILYPSQKVAYWPTKS